MPRREARDKVTKALSLIHKMHKDKIEGFLLSTYAGEAFNRVAWDYMFTTCSHVGLGNHLMSWISSLYHRPEAKVKVNGSLSDHVSIYNSTRQGCPLSLILFIISLEPFLCSINLNRVAEREYKSTAYADDLLFFIFQPHISLPNLLAAFSNFVNISNMRIIYHKSEALNISLPHPKT